MTIHLVILVASLKPTPKGKDLYDRRRDDEQPPVINNDEEGIGDHYKIELLLNQRK